MAQTGRPIEWDQPTFEAALQRVAAEGVIDARGGRLASEQLRQLLDAAPEDPEHRGKRLLQDANFGGATFSGDADFDGATFARAGKFGPVLVFGDLSLAGIQIGRAMRIDASAWRLSLNEAVFLGGADMFLRWAEVSLEGANFAEPSLMAELPPTPGRDKVFLGREELLADGGWVCRLDTPPAGFTPRIVSARRAKIARLTLSGVDLRACRFADAYELDELRLERTRFAQPPPAPGSDCGGRVVRRWRKSIFGVPSTATDGMRARCGRQSG